MGADWAATCTYWDDFKHPDGQIRGMAHLHPFRFVVTLPEAGGRPSVDISVMVGFALHTFTRGGLATDPAAMLYPALREDRVFDEDRYARSLALPSIVQNLHQRKVFDGLRNNYLTVEAFDEQGQPCEYRVFFMVQKWKEEARKTGQPCVRLIVQTAFAASLEAPRPRASRRQPVGFRVILSKALGLAR